MIENIPIGQHTIATFLLATDVATVSMIHKRRKDMPSIAFLEALRFRTASPIGTEATIPRSKENATAAKVLGEVSMEKEPSTGNRYETANIVQPSRKAPGKGKAASRSFVGIMIFSLELDSLATLLYALDPFSSQVRSTCHTPSTRVTIPDKERQARGPNTRRRSGKS